MKILYIILMHDLPDQAAEMIRTLTYGSSDSRALVHLDGQSAAPIADRLIQETASDDRIGMVRARIACPWGSFGLVKSVLNALEQAEEDDFEPEYVILLSGSCLPNRPIVQLERFLEENRGLEFIENGDDNWILDGWRQERYQYRFWFNHKTHPRLERRFFKLQRALGLKRRFPEGLQPRFGSQWWALTWDTCRKILAYNRRHPRHLKFFRQVWIPDELYFPTMVHHLVPAERIAHHGLTYYKFSDKGKPLVFHDDHVDFVLSLNRFFVRKADPEALRLRAACLAAAISADDGADLQDIGQPRFDYEVKMSSRTGYPKLGQLYYRDQFADMRDSVLKRTPTPYVVVLGPPLLSRAVAGCLSTSTFTCLGEVFAPNEVDLGEGRECLGGLFRQDAALRDLHPALFLARLKARCSGVPVMTWSPLHQTGLCQAVLRDPSAIVVTCFPLTGSTLQRQRHLLLQAAFGESAEGDQPSDADTEDAAWLEELLARANRPRAQDGLGEALFGGDIVDSAAQARIIALPWGPPGDAEARRRVFEQSLAACSFVAPWMQDLRTGLEEAFPVVEHHAAHLGGKKNISTRHARASISKS